MSKLSDEQLQAIKQRYDIAMQYAAQCFQDVQDSLDDINQLLAHIGEMEDALKFVDRYMPWNALPCACELDVNWVCEPCACRMKIRDALAQHAKDLSEAEAEEAYNKAVPVPLSPERITEIVKAATATPPREQGDGK